MYKCISDICKNKKIFYSDAWVKGENIDGSPSNICIRCGSELQSQDTIRNSEAPPVIFKGDGWPSADLKKYGKVINK